MAVAFAIAQRSLCERDKVGAVVVSKSNRLLETGYNGPPSGFVTDGVGCGSWCTRAMYANTTFPPELELHVNVPSLKADYSDCPSLHAEANALMRGDRFAREGGTIYVTSGVCFSCAKLIANSGLSTVFIDAMAYEKNHRNTEKSYAFLETCGVTVVAG